MIQPRDDSPEGEERRRANLAGAAPPMPDSYTAKQAAHYARLCMFEARAHMADNTGLRAEVGIQAATLLRRARTATGHVLAALEWPTHAVYVVLLAQVPAYDRARLSPEAVPWRFGKGEPRPALHLGALKANEHDVPPLPREGFDWLTTGANLAACERAALALTEDVGRVHDLLDGWDAAHGRTLPRPDSCVWLAEDYRQALKAVGIDGHALETLTLDGLLDALRDLAKPVQAPAPAPAHTAHPEPTTPTTEPVKAPAPAPPPHALPEPTTPTTEPGEGDTPPDALATWDAVASDPSKGLTILDRRHVFCAMDAYRDTHALAKHDRIHPDPILDSAGYYTGDAGKRRGAVLVVLLEYLHDNKSIRLPKGQDTRAALLRALFRTKYTQPSYNRAVNALKAKQDREPSPAAKCRAMLEEVCGAPSAK